MPGPGLTPGATRPSLAAILLAAGEGRRMGRPKALLEFPGGAAPRTSIDLCLAALAAADCSEIIVVLGAAAADIAPRGPAARARAIINPRWAEGMVTSIQAGLRALAGEYAACLLQLVDTPLASPALVAELAALWRRTGAPLALISDGRRTGHPVIFERALAGEILALEASQGANEVLCRHRSRAVYLETDEPGPFIDLDTPEDYRSARARHDILKGRG